MQSQSQPWDAQHTQMSTAVRCQCRLSLENGRTYDITVNWTVPPHWGKEEGEKGEEMREEIVEKGRKKR